MKQLRFLLSIFLLLLMLVPAHAQSIDTKVFYRLTNGSKEKLALDVYEYTNRGNYAPVGREPSESRSQLWRFVDEGDGLFRLINASQPNQSLDVVNDSITNEKVVLAKTEDVSGQLWRLSPNGNGFRLINGWQATKSLQVYLEGEDFGNVDLKTTGNNPGQIWTVQKTKIEVESKFSLTSTAFVDGARIPFEFTGERGQSPPLAWKGAPAGTKSFMILCTDPDAPSPAKPDPNPFVHWLMLNIPANTTFLLSGIPRLEQVSTPFGAIQLPNGFNTIGYAGPQPPKGSGKHRYFFTILAMDRVHVLDPKMSLEDFSNALSNSILGSAQLMGTYEVLGDPATNPETSPAPFRALMDEVIRLSNIERAKQGIPALKLDLRLENAATAHSEEMARLDYFSHDSPTPGRETIEKRILLSGISSGNVNENIAFYGGFPVAELAQESVNGWMNSPLHRRTLLDPSYTHIGVGISLKGDTYYLTQKFCEL